jgi:hypothetical protein
VFEKEDVVKEAKRFRGAVAEPVLSGSDVGRIKENPTTAETGKHSVLCQSID